MGITSSEAPRPLNPVRHHDRRQRQHYRRDLSGGQLRGLGGNCARLHCLGASAGSQYHRHGPEGLITDSRSGADFFNHLIALRNDLQAGNKTAIASTDSPALTTDLDNITNQISAAGLVQSQLSDADTVAATRAQSLGQMVSSDSSVNLTQTLTQLSKTQTAYQAALQSGASLLNSTLSLMNYVSAT